MSMVYWLSMKDEGSDEPNVIEEDLWLLLNRSAHLNAACETLNVTPLLEFVDSTEMEMEFSEEEFGENDQTREDVVYRDSGDLLKTLLRLKENRSVVKVSDEDWLQLMEEIKIVEMALQGKNCKCNLMMLG